MSAHRNYHRTPPDVYYRLAGAFGESKTDDGETVWVEIKLPDGSLTFFLAPAEPEAA